MSKARDPKGFLRNIAQGKLPLSNLLDCKIEYAIPMSGERVAQVIRSVTLNGSAIHINWGEYGPRLLYDGETDTLILALDPNGPEFTIDDLVITQ